MADSDKWFWQRRKWKVWLSGIAQGSIHGAATAGGAVGLIGGANMVTGSAVPQLTYKQLGAVLVAGAVSGGIAYLRQAPWPKPEDDTEIVAKLPTTP